MESEFASWLQGEMDKPGRKWKPADLAREARITEGTVSRILGGSRGVGRKTIKAIAKALKLPDTVVLYRAGFTDKDPNDPTQNMDPALLDFVQTLAGQPESVQAAVVAMAKAMVESFDRGSSGLPTDAGGSVARTNES